MCKHKTIDDFSRKTSEGRIWKCSVCGKEGFWNKKWAWYGKIECSECFEEIIKHVTCSKECKEKLLFEQKMIITN